MRKSFWAITTGAILAIGFAIRQFMAPAPLTADEMAARWATPCLCRPGRWRPIIWAISWSVMTCPPFWRRWQGMTMPASWAGGRP
jgi:hypothetical protein